MREPGGRYLRHREHRWPGLGLELARWRAGPATEGLCHVPEHLLFVTLGGHTARTEARIENGHRYAGADFPGAVTFIPADRRRVAWHGRGVIDYVTIRLDPAGLPAEVEPERVEFTGFTNGPDPLVRQLALALRAEAADGGVAGQLFVDNVAATLALHLVRRYSNLADHPPASAPGLAGARLHRVIEHIAAHLAGDLRLVRLAEVAGMDRYQFSRAFKQATGTAPHRYVVERRVHRATELLARTDLPIAEIAVAVGMSSQSHLTTVFRRTVGDTPLAYRKARRG
ncbi:helix-turn-helix domain-containing protein [Actinophytocola gossypii]|uniref:Helix-turn-helix transcriptional regulator n=1 Tax=Actinophytocola gossypii TaxID=2812003 RepID=A0ABT2J185_9PSEU|nr:AraC family transcriptional regulator [Actinophytocola gossypii]MCT2581624.1 helix-turn-helix transcriptional regulator [Actinophytocola gossypii]